MKRINHNKQGLVIEESESGTVDVTMFPHCNNKLLNSYSLISDNLTWKLGVNVTFNERFLSYVFCTGVWNMSETDFQAAIIQQPTESKKDNS